MIDKKNNVNYHEYLCKKSGMETSHKYLLNVLDDIPFQSPIRMDENRAADGLELRQEYYANNNGIIPREDDPSKKPCTFLEFLIAFAIKTYELTSYFKSEEWIFQWFIKNIDSKLIAQCDDMSIAEWPDTQSDYRTRKNLHEIFVRDSICKSIQKCQDRDYEYGKLGGNGCLFRYNQRNLPGDLRTMEYWKQLQYWVLELPISEE